MQTIEIEGHAGIRIILFNRPDKRNAFNLRMASDFARAVREADSDDSARVIVVTGRGQAFCAGADMSLFAGRSDDVPESELFHPANLHKLLLAVEKTLIAAVNGPAIGMGVTMLPCFDMVYAAEEATFLTPFVRLGLVCELGSSYTLPRLIGRQRASELLLRAKPIDALTAERWDSIPRPPDSPVSRGTCPAERSNLQFLEEAMMSSRRTNRQVSHHSLIALAVGLVACAEGVDDDRALGSPPRGTAGRSSGNGSSAGSAGNSASGGNAAGGGSAASGGSDHAALASVVLGRAISLAGACGSRS